jgi:hypothetical protein
VTIYAFAGRAPTLPAPTVRLGHDPAPRMHAGIRLFAE